MRPDENFNLKSSEIGGANFPKSGVRPPHSKGSGAPTINKPLHSKDSKNIAWPHAPAHRLSTGGTYFVTAGTYHKVHYFRDSLRLDVLQRGLLTVTAEFGWQLEAWCVFPNHYHFVAHSPSETADSLSPMLGKLHARLASWVNKLDGTPERRVWHNYWDTKLTYEKSYFARLHYTHANAVHHGLVLVPNQYRWCSARWFESTATPAQVKTIYSMKTDSVNVKDDFGECLMECCGLTQLSEK